MLKPSNEMEVAVSEQDEEADDDEDEEREYYVPELARDIAREVEDAFATVTYPGDDNLVSNPNYYECSEVIDAFRGKHWRDISLGALFDHRDKAGLFSPEGFRFYLPCYLVAGLIHNNVADTRGFLFSLLTPPESEGPRMDRFLKRISLLDARQKAALRRFIELWVETETSYPDPNRDRALRFWQRISPKESAEGS